MNDDYAIKVENVNKTFKLPHEKYNSIKSILINFYKRNKTFEMQKALENVSFEIKKGEFFGIVGRNGSGKSTMLKLLAGIYSPNSGSIQVNGSLTPFIELGVGFNAELTGRENIFLNGSLLGLDRKAMSAMYDEIVEFAELEKFMDQKLKNYSSGMQVRLAFSIAVRAVSDILLVDEVLAVGDANFQAKCFRYFADLKKKKQTVVFVSHDMSAVQKFCDRALLIDDGNVQFIGETNEVASRYMLDSVDTSPNQDNTKANPNFEFIKVKMEKSSESYEYNEKVSFTIFYHIKNNFSYDIGISIQKNGVSLHERNTKGIKLPNSAGEHSITWEAPAEILLQGLHNINVAAFTRKDFNLIAFLNNAASFFIKKDKRKVGGLVDMKSKWEVKQ